MRKLFNPMVATAGVAVAVVPTWVWAQTPSGSGDYGYGPHMMWGFGMIFGPLFLGLAGPWPGTAPQAVPLLPQRLKPILVPPFGMGFASAREAIYQSAPRRKRSCSFATFLLLPIVTSPAVASFERPFSWANARLKIQPARQENRCGINFALVLLAERCACPSVKGPSRSVSRALPCRTACRQIFTSSWYERVPVRAAFLSDMPFQEFTQFFSPTDLDAMTAAYYAACLQLIGTAALCFTQGGELRAKLVRVILAAACKGERNSKRLEEVALKALSHSRAD